MAQDAVRNAACDTEIISDQEFKEFCSLRRLTGTEGNRRAVEVLTRALEAEGFKARVDSSPESHWGILLGCSALVALSLYVYAVRHNPGMAMAEMLLGGSYFRAWRQVSRGEPVAVFGEREPVRTGSSMTSGDPSAPAAAPPAPTVVLGAHYDTASLPFHGSYIKMNLLMLLVLLGVTLVGAVTHPLIGIATSACCGFYLFGGNASPGADDNASGVFTVLACIRRLKGVAGVNIVPVFFNLEEQGLFGSRYWFRKRFGRKGRGLPALGKPDPVRTWMINFDCVGHGRRIFVSGNKDLREGLLKTAAARELGASATALYPSDHLSFRKPWQSVAFARADRYWMFSLNWIHGQSDVPEGVTLGHLEDISRIVEEFVRSKAGA